ncbi:PQQ-dependent sugar dehydrogenase [Hymenobacter terrenus]|uniref:PQQ-dependent sugar dehydrogenase n=1 Tax=Hymenobacter terrenus TaxID=1629124 RepID=UPI000698D425|nr:PQQ-dependent sugar dehydrogenase [Hymenobacter terrenus]
MKTTLLADSPTTPRPGAPAFRSTLPGGFFWLCSLWLAVFAFFAGSAQASTLPSGFSETRLATGLDPTGIEFAPDGRLFVTIKSGSIRVIKNGALLATPFVTIPNVDPANERGLQSVAFDPNFATNQFVYVYYTVGSTPAHNRVSRFTANGDVAVAGSETVLLELPNLGAGNHNGGALFFKGGKLYITTGENAVPSNSQSLTTTLGKILRINPDGSIPTDNPFYTTTTGSNRAIWALGYRNPFRAAVQPGTDKIFINDVGGSTWEEINDATIGGKNYGWPGIEGVRTTQTAPANYQNPVFAYNHSQGCSITGGTFFNPATTLYPSSYTGKYFFADYCRGYIKTLDTSNGNAVATFATGIDRPIDVKVSPDGNLYYLARGGLGGGSVNDNTASTDGEVWRVQYVGNNAPSISAQPTSATTAVGTAVSFVVGASGGAPLAYQWQRNNVNIAGATSSQYVLTSPTLADNGATFRVVVTNSVSSVTSASATLTVISNTVPTANITTPVTGAKYRAGDVISFSGTGTDAEDGALPASAYSWEVVFHHDTHTHPGPAPTFTAPATTGPSGTFVIPTEGETASNVWYTLLLRVTDSKGAQSTAASVEIYPLTSNLSFTTIPAGLQVTLDGQLVTTPASEVSVQGIERTLGVPSSQTFNNKTYQFVSWSQGGNATQVISTPTANTTYTATFQEVTPPTTTVLRPAENPTNIVAGLNYNYNQGTWTALPDFATLPPLRTGTTLNFDISAASQPDNFGFHFYGYVTVPTDGQYTFSTKSDDGSKLYIGNKLVVSNDGLHDIVEKSGTIGLKAGKHFIAVDYFEAGGGNILQVFFQGPGVAKQLIPASALFRKNYSGSTSRLTRGGGTAITAYPNPTSGRATLSYDLKQGGAVRLEVLDGLGRVVARLVDGEQTAGIHEAIFEAPAIQGTTFYNVRLITPDGTSFSHLALDK